MSERGYWAFVDSSTGKRLGCTAYLTSRDVAVRNAAEVFDNPVEVKEISKSEVDDSIAKGPPWVKTVLKMRERAVARPIRTVSTTQIAQQFNIYTIGKWRMDLMVFLTTKEPYFHASCRPTETTDGTLPSEDDMTFLGEVLSFLGAIPLPEPMGGGPSPWGVWHFRWPADVSYTD